MRTSSGVRHVMGGPLSTPTKYPGKKFRTRALDAAPQKLQHCSAQSAAHQHSRSKVAGGHLSERHGGDGGVLARGCRTVDAKHGDRGPASAHRCSNTAETDAAMQHMVFNRSSERDLQGRDVAADGLSTRDDGTAPFGAVTQVDERISNSGMCCGSSEARFVTGSMWRIRPPRGGMGRHAGLLRGLWLHTRPLEAEVAAVSSDLAHILPVRGNQTVLSLTVAGPPGEGQEQEMQPATVSDGHKNDQSARVNSATVRRATVDAAKLTVAAAAAAVGAAVG
jgi:hypothetical protein